MKVYGVKQRRKSTGRHSKFMHFLSILPWFILCMRLLWVEGDIGKRQTKKYNHFEQNMR